MPSKGTFISHFTCLVYVPDLENFEDTENRKLSSKETSI